jgi:hypothetical protein
MKYMIMMFGDQAGMMENPRTTPEWIVGMHGFMTTLNDELAASGEFVSGEGLADAPTAKTVSLVDGQVVVSDGPFAEAKESLAGYWILDVESEARVLEIASRIVHWSDRVEVRQVFDAPPEV